MENPTCPNCGKTMHLVRVPEKAESQHTFRCESCKLVFMTPDHQPVHPALKRNIQ
jgi:tRNA(Ile2) C34 agmatinyltransferase TiaS